MKNKIAFFGFISLIVILVPMTFVFAQNNNSNSDIQMLIKQLQEQIKALEAQITELRTQLEAVKIELKFTRTLSRGMTGDEVKQLQEFLKQFSDIYPEGLVTGYFGSLTEAAVKRLQEKQNIEPVGIVGPKTRTKLNELITEEAGFSGIVPPGLLVAPGIQKKLEPTATTALTGATTTPSGTVPAIPATPATPATPSPESGTPATPAIPATPATPAQSATTTPPIPPTPTPTSTPDTLGPWITNFFASPTSISPGGLVTFSVTAEDQAGIGSITVNIKYPNSSYYLRPNFQFSGATGGTQTFTETVDHGIQPTILGSYVIESITAADTRNNVSTYYPNGAVINSLQSIHNLTIPVIVVTATSNYSFSYNNNIDIPGPVYAVTFNQNTSKLAVIHASSTGAIISEINTDGSGLRYLFNSPGGAGESITYASSNGHYYTTQNGSGSSDSDRLYEIADDGTLVKTTVISNFGAVNPSGVVYHPGRNTLFISDIVADKIFEVSLGGSLIAQWSINWGSPYVSYMPIGIAYESSTGNLFILDITNAAQGFITTPIGHLITTTPYAFINGRPGDFALNPNNRNLYSPISTGLEVYIPQ